MDSLTASMSLHKQRVHKRLFDPDNDCPVFVARKFNERPAPSREQGARKPMRDVSEKGHTTYSLQENEYDPEPVLSLQPETRPISHDQLVVEVKGIYAGLVLVESKCIDIDQRQAEIAQGQTSRQHNNLTNQQWQALIHLHKTLLHEHHDFFLASQHPSANPVLTRLAKKYAMPARMWRHGIHSFLEVLRHRRPESLDRMLTFIYLAYSMMALLYETVPTFQDTWIECLGDLGRYRMIIEDDEQRDRDVWSGVAQFWYSKAADKIPNVGRLYHHLAILARPYNIEQLSYYTRCLTLLSPFENARSSIMHSFDPRLDNNRLDPSRGLGSASITAHAILFTEQAPGVPPWFASEEELPTNYPPQTNHLVPLSWRDKSSIVSCISAIAALVNEQAYLITYPSDHKDVHEDSDEDRAIEIPSMESARQRGVLWPSACSLVMQNVSTRCRPLPEDFTIKGKLYSQCYFPTHWFTNIDEENEERIVETPATELPQQPLIFCVYVCGSAFQNILDYCRRPTATLKSRKYIAVLSRCIRTLLVCLTIAPPIVAAKPLRGSDPPSLCVPKPRDLLTTILTAFAHAILTASILAGAHYLAEKKGHTSVYGFLMTVLAFGWWAIRNDVSTTSWSLWAVLILWSASAIQFAQHACQEICTMSSATLMTITLAVIFDLSIASFVHPSEASVSQADLLTLSLPSLSLGLAVTLGSFTALRRHRSSHIQYIPLLPQHQAEQLPRTGSDEILNEERIQLTSSGENSSNERASSSNRPDHLDV